MWSFIPRIYVATLVSSDRLSSLQLEFDKAQIPRDRLEFNYQLSPLIKSFENGTLSCTDNHQQIYRKALKANFPFICIFEDDVYFEIESLREVLLEVKKFISLNNNWDFLYLGNFPWKVGDTLSGYQYIRENSISWCTHAYLISQRGIRFMLRRTPEQILKCGRLVVPTLFDMVFREGGGIDTFMAYYASRGILKSYTVSPMIVYQHSIPKWKLKAKIAEYLSLLSNGGMWVKNLLIAIILVVGIFVKLLLKTNFRKSS